MCDYCVYTICNIIYIYISRDMFLMRESMYQPKYAMEEYVFNRITLCCVINTQKNTDLYLVFIAKLYIRTQSPF